MKNIEAHRRLGNWLKEKRVEAGLSQSQLADLIGRHKTFIGKYEAGRRLEICEFVRISVTLGADPHEGVKLVMDGKPQRG
jgi:transcriptional regulator with XRE-family HTH domain